MLITPEQTARHLATLAQARDERVIGRLTRLRMALPRAKEVLVGQFGARRVWVFGSLVAGTPNEHSDVGLAVEGLPSDRYFAALAELMALFGSAVDLVRLDDADESLKQCIAADGRAL